MKKLIILFVFIALVALTVFVYKTGDGCTNKGCEHKGDYSINTYIIDSCEYYETFVVGFGYQLIHKHNCSLCVKRRKQELEELVKTIKEK